MSGYFLRYNNVALFEDAIRVKKLGQDERFQHTTRLSRERLKFVEYVARLQQSPQNGYVQTLPPIVEARGLRQWNQLVQVEKMLSVLGYWISRLDDNESSCGLISHFMPQGSCSCVSKKVELGSGCCC